MSSRLRRRPWRTLRIPPEVKSQVVGLVLSAADEDRDALSAAILSGQLFERPNSLYLPNILPTYCGLLSREALDGAPVSEEAVRDFFPEVEAAAQAMPVEIERVTLSMWLRLLAGVDPSKPAYYRRPEDYDLIGVCAPLAIAGAAARKAQWLRPVWRDRIGRGGVRHRLFLPLAA